MRRRLVCDLSEATGVRGSDAPDLIITAGISFDEALVPRILSDIRTWKHEELGYEDVPVKWNLKDTDRALQRHGHSELKRVLIDRSEAIRSALVRILCESQPTVFVSVLEAHSTHKAVLSTTKPELSQYSFSNLLMHFGLWCRDKHFEWVQLVLDWPESSRPEPFITEYISAWSKGLADAGNGQQRYFCGPLSRLRFEPGLYFGITDSDPLLQLADLVVGASRSFVRFALGELDATEFGVQQLRALLPHIHRLGASTIGYGIAVSPTKSPVADKLANAVASLSS